MHEDLIAKLTKALDDEDYRRTWTANLAMAQLDAEKWYSKEHNKVGKYLNRGDRYTIANNGAKHFLNLLTGKTIR